MWIYKYARVRVYITNCMWFVFTHYISRFVI